MNRFNEEIQKILAAFQAPAQADYPEPQNYSREEIYTDFFGGSGL